MDYAEVTPIATGSVTNKTRVLVQNHFNDIIYLTLQFIICGG